MMLYCMEKYIQAASLPGGYRNHRNIAQHLGKPVEIQLHPPLLHNIHHVKSQDHRFAKLQKLQREVQVPLQG